MREQITKQVRSQEHYAGVAVLALGLHNINFPHESPFGWLCGINLLANGGAPEFDSDDYRGAILAELGKIPNNAELRWVALKICDLQPDTTIAKNLIQNYMENRKPENTIKLLHAIENTVGKFRAENPGICHLDVYKAAIHLKELYIGELEECGDILGIND